MDQAREGKLFGILSFLKIFMGVGSDGRNAVNEEELEMEVDAFESESESEGRSGPMLNEQFNNLLKRLISLLDSNRPKAIDLFDRLIQKYAPFADFLP